MAAATSSGAASALFHVTATQPFPFPVTCPLPRAAKMALCRAGRCGAVRLWGSAPPLLAALSPVGLCPSDGTLQFRRDVLKAVPVALIAIPPFANFLVLLLMYFFPRQLLIRHFWTPRQQQEFSEENHSARQAAYPAVLSCLDTAVQSLPQQQLQHRLRELCVEVQRGRHPLVAELCAVQSLFSGPALRLGELRAAHLRALSRVLFLTPLLPAVLVRRRLRSHLLEIRHLDRALARLGLAQLSEEELRAACYLRGLNPAQLSAAQCRAWLEQWLRLSCVLQASEASLLANSMVLLSLNYAGAKK
ncbi:LOW QUALITY PROTEIN: LETM1 domain-containing protein 1 [Phasianus colchicus]|uniref:LOW QUALITY PROTEIN: LETM1 domain-containing protein 1 n=1 Tax=Phasianus colchicus TaxID=9054 RepID=UPI00129DBF26|nr:LOW QUALITY PROTEIN: LETM1 domain-containing protein 1 [Phasianus colchicus]